MPPIRTLIVEDEPLARETLRQMLGAYPDILVTGEAADGAEAVRILNAERPQLVFLDIQLPKLTGIEVIKKVGAEKMPLTIFVTAYDDFALKAFEINAVDYLLKPFSERRLGQSIARVRERLGEKDTSQFVRQIRSLIQMYGSGQDGEEDADAQGDRPSRLAVRDGAKTHYVEVDKIEWIEAADYYVVVHSGGRKYILRESLNKLEKRLPEAYFTRVHRGALVNLKTVQSLEADNRGNYRLMLTSGAPIPLSRHRKEAVERLLERLK